MKHVSPKLLRFVIGSGIGGEQKPALPQLSQQSTTAFLTAAELKAQP